MHIYFSGLGGKGIAPLATVAQKAGYTVSGSDRYDSPVFETLISMGSHPACFQADQSGEHIRRVFEIEVIDWFVYSSAVAIEDGDNAEFRFCRQKSIKMTKRDELLKEILVQQDLKLLAIAGTHGKTTTTAIAVWLAQQLQFPISYSVGGPLPFAPSGQFDPASRWFIYEADEYDRNFLAFNPNISIVVGIDWDHQDIYPTRQEYHEAFEQFISQSRHTILWEDDIRKFDGLSTASSDITSLSKSEPLIAQIPLPGPVLRENAFQILQVLPSIISESGTISAREMVDILAKFPGVNRRFEKIAPDVNIYTDHAATVPKIRGTLGIAREVMEANEVHAQDSNSSTSAKVVVIYEGFTNTRQHFHLDNLKTVFDDDFVKKLYIVPTYLAREDKSLVILTPEMLVRSLSPLSQAKAIPVQHLDDSFKSIVQDHLKGGDTLVCFSSSGQGGLDFWLRKQFG